MTCDGDMSLPERRRDAGSTLTALRARHLTGARCAANGSAMFPKNFLAGAACLLICHSAFATFHLWRINEIYSNADGTEQFVELATTADGQDHLGTRTLASNSNTFTFPANLPGDKTANRFVLIATGPVKGVTPDYTIPQHFFDPAGDTINFANGIDTATFASSDMPTDGVRSFNPHGPANLHASPANFAGVVAGHVLTQHNDRFRTGANMSETALTPASVNVSKFGKLFTRTVQGQIYAQPLYVPDLPMPAKTGNVSIVRNVVFVATEHNIVYAFDADSAAESTPLWQVNLGAPAVVGDIGGCSDLIPEIGITATPVIDIATATMYVEAKSKESGGLVHKLHALDVTTGAEKFGGPVVITASVPGSGDGGDGSNVPFNPRTQHSRPGLLLSNGVVYLGFASHCDFGPYHGWIIGYDAKTLAQTAVLNTTPNGGLGGVWQAGNGLSADPAGNIFFMTGNGTFSADGGGSDFGDSFLKLTPGLSETDFFTPFNQDDLNNRDADLGSSGPILIPGTNLLFGGGKDGVLYLVDGTNMGHFHAGDDSQIVQSFGAASSIFSAPVFWNSTAYIWGNGDNLKAYHFGGATFDTTPSSTSNPGTGFPGGPLSISANGTTAGTGIVWGINRDGGSLDAFDASDVSNELWNSNQNPSRDRLSSLTKFAVPTVAGGKVFVPTSGGQLVVYGKILHYPPGTYSGVAVPAPGSDPAFVTVSVGSGGTFRATIVSSNPAAGAATVNAAFDNNGHFSGLIAPKGKPSFTLTLDINMDGGTDQITGSTSTAGGAPLTTFTLDRAVFSAKTNAAPNFLVGAYTLRLPRDPNHTESTAPQGDGYGTITIDANGFARFTGVLGDGTRVSAGASISKNFAWPFFIAPYKNIDGAISGVLTFHDFNDPANTNHIDGTLNWFKAASANNSQLYPGGFTIATAVQGSHYVAQPPALDFGGGTSNAKLTIGAGNVDPSQKILTLGADNKIALVGSEPFKMSISLSTGAFSGSFFANGKTRNFGGVVLQKQNFGAGAFVGNGQTGFVDFEKN
jgi:hypothetical protein